MPRIAPSAAEAQRNTICKRIRHHYDDIRRERGCCRIAAKTMGFTYETLNNRLHDPGSLTLRELQGVANAMNISLATLVSGKEATYE